MVPDASSGGQITNAGRAHEYRYGIIKGVRASLSTDEVLWLYDGPKVPAVSDLPTKEAYEVSLCLMGKAVSTTNPRLLEVPLRHLQRLNSEPPLHACASRDDPSSQHPPSPRLHLAPCPGGCQAVLSIHES